MHQVETLFAYGYENCWTNDDGTLVTFETEAQAQSYLNEYIDDMLDAVRSGDITDFDTQAFRITRVKSADECFDAFIHALTAT